MLSPQFSFLRGSLALGNLRHASSAFVSSCLDRTPGVGMPAIPFFFFFFFLAGQVVNWERIQTSDGHGVATTH
jgi:hypothetical protein